MTEQNEQCPCEYLQFDSCGNVKCSRRSISKRQPPKNADSMLSCTYNYYNFRDCPNSKDCPPNHIDFEKNVLQYIQTKKGGKH